MSAAEDEWEELFGEWGRDGSGQPLPLTVERYAGPGMVAQKFDPPMDLPGIPQVPQERVVKLSDGNERLSSTVLYPRLSEAQHFTTGSRVVLANGRQSVVLAIETLDWFALFSYALVRVE